MNGKTVGDILREARISRQLQLTDLEKTTGMAVQDLLALELDQFSLIPEEKVTHYLMTYAENVNLDPENLLEQYKKQISFQDTLQHVPTQQTEAVTDEVTQQGTFERRSHRRRRSHREESQKKSILPALVLTLLSVAIICLVGYLTYKQWPTISQKMAKETTSETTSSTATESTTLSETESTTVTTEPPTTVKTEIQEDGSLLATVSTNKEKVDVVFTLNDGESWVGLTDDITGEQGTILTENQKEFTLPVNKGTSSFATVGHPQAVTVTVDGQTIDLTELANFSPANFFLRVE